MKPITYSLELRGQAVEREGGLVAGDEGQFEGANGRITSNFFLSDTGELTENQLGVMFASMSKRSA